MCRLPSSKFSTRFFFLPEDYLLVNLHRWYAALVRSHDYLEHFVTGVGDIRDSRPRDEPKYTKDQWVLDAFEEGHWRDFEDIPEDGVLLDAGLEDLVN